MRLRVSLFGLLFLAVSGSAAAQNDLILTGVVDGPLPGGLPKAIELYVVNDIADLNVYGVGSANNADGTNGVEFAFPAVAASAGSFLYVASDSTGFADFFGMDPTYTSSAANINGDDSIELFYDAAGVAVAGPADVPATTTVVDVFGEVGTDGTGQPWEYMDGWVYRMDGTGPDGSTFVLANWTFSGIDALDGATTNATATTPFPIGSYSGGGGSGEPVLTALLRGANEVPPVETDAVGGATLTLDGTMLTVTGVFDRLSGTYLFAHLHGGAEGQNGPVRYPLTATVNSINRGGAFEASANTFEVRSTFADSLRAGLVYVNVHSSEFPGGEIRGQVGTAPAALAFTLSGDNEVPPVMTPATGSGTATLNGSTLTIAGTFAGLTGDYRASHIHAGAVGQNGPVVQALAPTVNTDNRSGTFASNTFQVRRTFADSIRAGLAYVNVHSATFPSGEIRGQIGLDETMIDTAVDGGLDAGLALTVANPVRGQATVQVTLGTPGPVDLALFDVLGRRVATLAEGLTPTASTARLDASGLAAGVYVLRLQTEGGTLSRTLTVVR